MKMSEVNISPGFQPISQNYYSQVIEWLDEPHIKEFWDNSPELRQDILIFMNGRKEPSPYVNGIFDYWIGFEGHEPYCLVMTSEIFSTESELTDLWRSHLSKSGRTFSVDFMIGNKKYLHRGLGSATLKAFIKYIHNSDPLIDTFFIDPSETNPRAKYVYEKSGFETVGTFLRDFEGKKDVKHILMVLHCKNE